MCTPRMVVFFAGALVVAGCSRPEPPKLVPKEMKVTSLGPQGAGLVVRLEATNPNRVSLSARSVSAKAKLDGKWELGTVTMTSPVVLPSGTPTDVDVAMTLPWADLKAVSALALATGPVPYTVEGTVNVGNETLNVDLPFSLSGTLTREQIIAAALKPALLPGLQQAR